MKTYFYVVICIFCSGFIVSQMVNGFDLGSLIAFASFALSALTLYIALLAYKQWEKSLLYSQMEEMRDIYEQRFLQGIKINELVANKLNVDKNLHYLDIILYNKGWSVLNVVSIQCDELKVAWNDSLLRGDEFKHWESGADVAAHYKVVFESESIVNEAIERIIKNYCVK